MLDINPFKAGNVYFCKIHGDTNAMIYKKSRPVLIVNTVSLSTGVVMVAPITTKTDKNGVPVKLEDNYDSTIVVERLMPVNIRSLTRFIGNLSDEVMAEVRYAINLMFNGGSSEDMDKYFPFRTKYNVHIADGPKNIIINNDEPITINHGNNDVEDFERSNFSNMFIISEQTVVDIEEPVEVIIGESILEQNMIDEFSSEPEPIPASEPEPIPASEPEPIPASEPEPIPASEPDIMINLEKINHKPLIKAQTYTTIMDIVNESDIKTHNEVVNSFKYKKLKSRLNQYEKQYQDIIITGVIRGLQISDIYKLIETGSVSSSFFNIDKPFVVNTPKVFNVDENLETIIEVEGTKTKKKKVFVNLSKMSHNELLWISNATINEVAKELNVCVATARKHKLNATKMLAQ